MIWTALELFDTGKTLVEVVFAVLLFKRFLQGHTE